MHYTTVNIVVAGSAENPNGVAEILQSVAENPKSVTENPQNVAENRNSVAENPQQPESFMSTQQGTHQKLPRTIL